MTPVTALLLALLGATSLYAQPSASPAKTEPALFPDVQLAPFVVHGKSLQISIHARTKADRRYAERFADDVIAVAHEVLAGETGRGLIIVGQEGEPHPVQVVRTFLAMAGRHELHPETAALAPALKELLIDWQRGLRSDKASGQREMNLDFESIVHALPLPLEGVVAQLYHRAWAVDFRQADVEAMLRSLEPSHLAAESELTKFAWIFYLPPRRAMRQVVRNVVPEVLKQWDLNGFQRTALRGAAFVFKPAIRTAIEAARKAMLMMAVLRAQTTYPKDDVMAISMAYMKVLLPDFKFNGSTLRERAVDAIRAQIQANADRARDPSEPRDPR